MTWGALLFGLGAIAVLALNLSCRRSIGDGPAIVSGVLFLLWAATVGSILLFGIPDGLRLYPLFDAMAAVAVATLFVGRPGWWKGIMLASFIGLGALHGALWAQELYGSANVGLYLKVLDIITLLQLATVAWPGGYRVAVLVRDGVRGRDLARRMLGG